MSLGAVILVDGKADPAVAGADSVEVYECLGDTTAYRIRYSMDIGDGDLPLLKDDRLSVGSDLAIVVRVNGRLSCLVKGPVYAQQIRLIHSGSGSYVDVLGADPSITLDRENKAKVWPDATDADIVTAILKPHFDQQDVEPTAATHAEARHLRVQRETDLAFLRRLARQNGCLLWVTCDENGKQTAHFKRPPVGAAPAAELVLNIHPPKLKSFDIAWDAERPVSAVAGQLDLNTKQAIDGSVAASPLAALGARDLASIAPGVQALHLAAPVDEAGDLQSRAEAALIESGFFVRATGVTTTHALGTVLRAHTVVTVRGAGSRHSGTYFCARVRHTIASDEHYMDVELLRNAWGA